MINRSGFLRLLLTLSGASFFGVFTGCAGKIVSIDTTSSDGGVPGDGGGGCTGAISCPYCEGDSNPRAPQCIDGEWSCPTTKCEPPQLGCEDSLPPACDCTAVCNDNTWTCPTDCSDTCPSDITGLAGTACSVEGLICGGEDCTNPCDFCNFIGCQGGVWTNEEAPPEPCPIDGGAFDGG